MSAPAGWRAAARHPSRTATRCQAIARTWATPRNNGTTSGLQGSFPLLVRQSGSLCLVYVGERPR